MYYNKIRHQWRRAAFLALMLIPALAAWANVSVSFSGLPLRKAMREIEKVSDLHFFYKTTLEGLDTKVSLSVKDVTAKELLDKLFASVPLGYSLEANGVVVVYNEKEPVTLSELNATASSDSFTVTGVVTDEADEPVIGATVRQRGSRNAVATDHDGRYSLSGIRRGDVVEVSYIGYEPQSVRIASAGVYDIRISENISSLNEVVVAVSYTHLTLPTTF